MFLKSIREKKKEKMIKEIKITMAKHQLKNVTITTENKNPEVEKVEFSGTSESIYEMLKKRASKNAENAEIFKENEIGVAGVRNLICGEERRVFNVEKLTEHHMSILEAMWIRGDKEEKKEEMLLWYQGTPEEGIIKAECLKQMFKGGKITYADRTLKTHWMKMRIKKESQRILIKKEIKKMATEIEGKCKKYKITEEIVVEID